MEEDAALATVVGSQQHKQQQEQNDSMGAGKSRKGIKASLGLMCKGIFLTFFIQCWLFKVK